MSIKLIIADDHEIVRLGLRAALKESIDIEIVSEADNGVTAVAKSIDTTPDVVLMDIRMPQMDGIEATKQIKDNIQLQNTRVLILTSNDNQEDLFAALAAGADGYCLKDTPVKELILAIQAVHSGATWLDPLIARLVLRSATSSSLSPSAKTSPFGLSPREVEILRLLVDGLRNNEMAAQLMISLDTVKTHMRHIMEKLQVSDRTQAAVKAMREGLI